MSLEAQVAKLEAVVRQIQANGGGGGEEGGESAAKMAWDDYFKAAVQPFIDACNAEEGTKKIGAWTQTAFEHTGKVITATGECAKPSQESFMKFADPIVQVIQGAGNPDSRAATFPQEKAFAEVIQALSFIMMDSSKEFILGQLEAADFYLNKVLTGVKDKADPEKANGRAYVKTIKALVQELAEFAGQYSRMGLMWKVSGGADVLTWTPGGGGAKTEHKEASVEDRLSAATQALALYAASMGAGDSADGTPAKVVEWAAFLADHVAPFSAACRATEGTEELGQWTDDSFAHMTKVIQASLECKKPSDEALMGLLGPIVKVIEASGNPDSRAATFPQQKAFAEIIQAHSWVMMPMSKPFILGQLEAADFYLNKVLTSVKDKPDPEKQTGRDFVRLLKQLMTQLADYTFKHFKTGLEWNGKGSDLKDFEA